MTITRTDTLNIDRVLSKIEDNAERFVIAATAAAAVRAMAETPRAYGVLANSQFTKIKRRGRSIKGIVGYGAEYAKYLNGMPGKPTPNWSPVSASNKKAPSDNMNARPEFLTRAFTSRRALADNNRLLAVFKI